MCAVFPLQSVRVAPDTSDGSMMPPGRAVHSSYGEDVRAITTDSTLNKIVKLSASKLSPTIIVFLVGHTKFYLCFVLLVGTTGGLFSCDLVLRSNVF